MADHDTYVPTNVPLHAPLYSSVRGYQSEATGISILLEVEEQAIKSVLEPTPFEYMVPYVWLELFTFLNPVGMAPYEERYGDPYGSWGFIIPARFKDRIGGYYAACFKNKDYGMAPGREGSGYPIKHATVRMHRIGRAVTACLDRPTARMEMSIVIDDRFQAQPPPEATRSPTLLLQTIPAAEEDNAILLKRVFLRDVATSSNLTARAGEPAVNFLRAPSGVDDLAWISNGNPIYGEFTSGLFKSAKSELLSTEYVSPRLRV